MYLNSKKVFKEVFIEHILQNCTYYLSDYKFKSCNINCITLFWAYIIILVNPTVYIFKISVNISDIVKGLSQIL